MLTKWQNFSKFYRRVANCEIPSFKQHACRIVDCTDAARLITLHSAKSVALIIPKVHYMENCRGLTFFCTKLFETFQYALW